jgi:hypothetical protein
MERRYTSILQKREPRKREERRVRETNSERRAKTSAFEMVSPSSR